MLAALLNSRRIVRGIVAPAERADLPVVEVRGAGLPRSFTDFVADPAAYLEQLEDAARVNRNLHRGFNGLFRVLMLLSYMTVVTNTLGDYYRRMGEGTARARIDLASSDASSFYCVENDCSGYGMKALTILTLQGLCFLPVAYLYAYVSLNFSRPVTMTWSVGFKWLTSMLGVLAFSCEFLPDSNALEGFNWQYLSNVNQACSSNVTLPVCDSFSAYPTDLFAAVGVAPLLINTSFVLDEKWALLAIALLLDGALSLPFFYKPSYVDVNMALRFQTYLAPSTDEFLITAAQAQAMRGALVRRDGMVFMETVLAAAREPLSSLSGQFFFNRPGTEMRRALVELQVNLSAIAMVTRAWEARRVAVVAVALPEPESEPEAERPFYAAVENASARAPLLAEGQQAAAGTGAFF